MGNVLKTWIASISILVAGAVIAGSARAEVIAPLQRSAASAPALPMKNQAAVGLIPSAQEVNERVNTAIGTAAFVLVMAAAGIVWTVRKTKYEDNDFWGKYD